MAPSSEKDFQACFFCSYHSPMPMVNYIENQSEIIAKIYEPLNETLSLPIRLQKTRLTHF